MKPHFPRTKTGGKSQNVPARPPGGCPERGPPSVPPPAPRGARLSSVGPNDDQDVRCAAHDGAPASCHPMQRMLGENIRAACLIHGVVPDFVCPADARCRPGGVPGHRRAPRRIRVSSNRARHSTLRPQMLAPAHPRTLQPYRGPPRRPAPRCAAHMSVHGPPGCGARPAGRPGALPGGTPRGPCRGASAPHVSPARDTGRRKSQQLFTSTAKHIATANAPPRRRVRAAVSARGPHVCAGPPRRRDGFRQ